MVLNTNMFIFCLLLITADAVKRNHVVTKMRLLQTLL